MSDFTRPFRLQFKRAAAEGAELELLVRMVCETVPQLQPLAHDKHLLNAEQALVEHYSAHLSAEEKVLLESARRLRNKILHADFHAARSKLREAGESPGGGDVRMFTLDTAGDVSAQLTAITSSEFANGRMVAETKSTRDGTVYGWLLEMGLSGDFERAVSVFQRATSILERLVRARDE